jgi:hypothetical protein
MAGPPGSLGRSDRWPPPCGLPHLSLSNQRPPHTNPLPRKPFSSPFVCSVTPPRRHSPNQTRLPFKRSYPFSRAPPLLRAPSPLVSSDSRACVCGGEWVTWEEETGGRRRRLPRRTHRRRRPEAAPTTWWSWSTGSSGGMARCLAVADLPSISSRNWDWARFSIAPSKTYCRTLFSWGTFWLFRELWGISSYELL